MTPPFDPQLIGRTENALRAILDRLLAGTEVGYPEWGALVLTVTGGGSIDRNQLADRVARSLKVERETAESRIRGLAAKGLVQTGPEASAAVVPTEAGQQLVRQVRAQVGEITGRLYGDIAAADLEAASRVLSTVLERAEAELDTRP
jgi:DNA-binding MarR family transcriptional regulator